MASLAFKVLSAPRQTMRLVKKFNSNLVFFSFIVGFISIISAFTQYTFIDFLNRAVLVALSFILAIPVGYILLCIIAFFTFITGKILNGKADFVQIRCALAYSRMPLVVNVVIWIIQLIVFYPILFSQQFFDLVYSNQSAILVASSYVQYIFNIYAFILLLHTLGEVQKFSAWMSLWNMIFQTILFVICVAIISSLFLGTRVWFHMSSFINFQSVGVIQ